MTAARRARLAEALRGRRLDGILVTGILNVRYLSGFTGSNGALLLASDEDCAAVLLTDGRYRAQATAEAPDVDLVVTRDMVGEAASRMAGRWAVETHLMSVDLHRELLERTAAVELLGAERAVERQREVKDEVECDALRRACAVSTRALEELLAGPLLGRSERQVARDLESRMLEAGAEAVAFETIVAAGPNAAIPHHAPTDAILAPGDLLKIDFGARVDGMHADCTRTVVLGSADAWQREAYAVVRASQRAGLDALRAGRQVRAAWDAATGVLGDAGWLEHFTTGLGHGVGLEIHEDPFIGPRSTGRLISRHTVTMEPGVYVPGRGGVRIEDTVIVTEGACEVLTPMTTDLLEIS